MKVESEVGRVMKREPAKSSLDHDATPRGSVHMAVVLTLVTTWVLTASPMRAATLEPETVQAWEDYVCITEKRIASELRSNDRFLAQEFLPQPQRDECRRANGSGKVCVIKLGTRDQAGRPMAIPGGMVHHWLGSVFVPGVSVDQMVEWVQRYSDHVRYFEEVEDSQLLSRQGDEFKILLRLRRKKIVTVHYNTEHEVIYQRLLPGRVFSWSFTTKIAELENPGTSQEREKPEGKDNGFLWRLNSYWRYRQVEGGVVVECESISLSRTIPSAIRWLVGGYVNSVPRESMTATLASIREGMRAKSLGE